MKRLVVAGEAWDVATGAYVGARLVRLDEEGSWEEIAAPATTGAWYLREYIDTGGTPRLFHIAANGTSSRPRRGSLYRSISEGDTWADISPPLGYCMGISHGAGDRLWAITDEREDPVTAIGGPSYIYYSDDWGDTWMLSYTITDVSFGNRFWPLFNIAAHPTDASKVVVEGTEMVGWDTRMWRTTDAGGSWSAAFDPVFPVGVDNVGGAYSLSLTYAADGSLVHISRASAASTTIYIFRSTDDGANFLTWYSDSRPFSGNDGMYFLEECAALYFISEQRTYVAADWVSGVTTLADNVTAPFSASEFFRGIACPDGANLIMGTYTVTPDPGCCDPAAVWTRPTDLSTDWIEHPRWATMDSDLGYRVYCWPGGVLGATEYEDRYEVPADDPDGAGDWKPQCIPIMSWEISVDGKNFYTRSRAQGMGMNNPGQAFTAEIDSPEIWSPNPSTVHGEEGGAYNVHRELVVNDYGINEAGELQTLAGAYLPLRTKQWGGITTVKFTVGGMPRASDTAPTPSKILQAGDLIWFCHGSEARCNIAEGDWIIDEVHYSFPKGITTVVASRRPAAQAVRTRGTSGNIRNLGETIANEFGVWESPWFSVEDTEFFMNPNAHDADKFYGVFKMEHYMGVIPRTYIVLAAKQKIYDWYNDEAVIAAQPLYVPRQFLDISQVQGVGYNLVAIDEIQAIFHFWRYLFYDGIDSRWVPPEDRYLKIWLIA